MATATDTSFAPTSQRQTTCPSRRAVLGCMAASAVATPVLTGVETVDPHPGWQRERAAVSALWSSGLPRQERLRLFDDIERLEALIATTPASTRGGVLVQLDLIAEWFEEGCFPVDECKAAFHNVRATLRQLPLEGWA